MLGTFAYIHEKILSDTFLNVNKANFLNSKKNYRTRHFSVTIIKNSEIYKKETVFGEIFQGKSTKRIKKFFYPFRSVIGSEHLQ